MDTPNNGLAVLTLVALVSVGSAFAQDTRTTYQSGVDAGLPAVQAQPCTTENGQRLIDEGHYQQAIREFTCVIEAEPTDVEGYRGRIKAQLLLGRYADAYRDFSQLTAFVLPVHPDARNIILAHYDARLATAPDNIAALMGASFAYWCFFDYAQAIHVLNHLLEVQPDNVFGNLFRGSSRLLQGATKEKGVADIDRALALAPGSADVRFIVADAYTYGLPDPERAFAEASLALEWGLDTPRVHAILASSYLAFGDEVAAGIHIQRHIELVTTELLVTSPIAAGTSLALDLVPGRTYEIPVPALAGETLSIMTSSRDFWDTILVLLGPDGSPVLGSDDYSFWFAGLETLPQVTGTYRLQVTSFESVNTGELLVTRK